jgi:hypothetical protein
MVPSFTYATRHRRSFVATVVLLLLAVAPLALAQTAPKPKKKKGAKPAASASASAAEEAAPSAAPAAEPSAEPAAAPTPSASETTTPPEAGTESAATEPAANDATNTTEDPTKTYKFVGVRYRGTIIPAFLEHLFVDEGGTVYSNTIGAEFDWRKEAKSTIVWLQYTEYGFGDTLFLQKSKDASMANNYSDVSSALKGIYVGLDELWSTPVANHVDFEYGFGLGLGAIFGNLYNNWVYQNNPNGALVGANGNHYAQCQSQTDGGGNGQNPVNICQPSAHQNASVAKVGNYTEPNWFQGGAVPVIFPHIAGQLGFRYKPIKQLQTRLDLGISLTGFWFGLSADYGLEKTDHEAGHPAATPPAKETSPAEEHKESRADGLRDTL